MTATWIGTLMVGKKTKRTHWLVGAGMTLMLSSTAVTGATGQHQGLMVDYPTVKYGKGEQATRIKHGEYLVKAGDCIACHTTPGGKPFSGGLPIKTPFGTIYSQNITPDPETGLGRWSDKDFIRAMKEGVAPDGSYYFPVFPYMYFNAMSDQDILDIKAYLDAIPAVNNPNKPVEMGIPFRWRLLQLGWRVLFYNFYRGEFKPDPSQSAQWNRGKYLVDGPGHCSMCHTPMNPLGAPKRKYYLTGGFVDGYYAPNISSTALKAHKIDDIVNVFLHDRKFNGGKLAAPPMLEVNYYSLSRLKREDLEAIATYLQSVVSKTPPATKHADKVDLSVGKDIYNKYCVGCHATGAGGAFKYGDVAAWKPLVDAGVDKLYKNAIVGIGNMPAKGNCATCIDIEIQSAVDYIVHGIGDGSTASVVESKPKVSLPKPTLKRGKQIYTEVCSVCHAEGKLKSPKMGDKKAWKPRIKQNMDVLYQHAIRGFKGHPAKGACYDCSDTDVIAATKYMVEQSKTEGDYTLW